MMEERKHLLVKRAEEYKERRMIKVAEGYCRKAEDIKNHIEHLKAMLIVIEKKQT